ncbi:hypothetical protein HPP92_009007 [Vanilla planifolia]|uniref:Uncharacterized protein n=1 Tax=Vanilla planifolia TaxID=51239 RepID=A0A835RJ30_VANPL|nr:hypothetical protein HPP92_009007 [Vanilla planifolia]
MLSTKTSSMSLEPPTSTKFVEWLSRDARKLPADPSHHRQVLCVGFAAPIIATGNQLNYSVPDFYSLTAFLLIGWEKKLLINSNAEDQCRGGFISEM